MNAQQVGLFGGSFDPPHLGHVALVEAGLAMGLDQVYVIPALPVHRELSGLASARMRFDWLVAMFADYPDVQVVDWEISRNQITPAIDTLRRFHGDYPLTIPWLMMGADAWSGLPAWRDYPAHRELCNVAVFARRGMAVETVCGHEAWQQIALDKVPNCQMPGHWVHIQALLPDIAATDLRTDAGQGKALTGKVAEIVRRKIEQAYGKATEKM